MILDDLKAAARAALPDEPRVHRWTREGYYRIADAGLFEGKRVELIEGTVVEMSAMERPHWAATLLTSERLRQAFGSGYSVTTNMPLYLGESSDPEPDVAVLSGAVRDYPEGTATPALLVVEVSETSLRYDRAVKSSLYALHGIPEYWILNVVERTLEVRRSPEPDAAEPFGFRYSSTAAFGLEDAVSPLACPDAALRVAELLP